VSCRRSVSPFACRRKASSKHSAVSKGVTVPCLSKIDPFRFRPKACLPKARESLFSSVSAQRARRLCLVSLALGTLQRLLPPSRSSGHCCAHWACRPPDQNVWHSPRLVGRGRNDTRGRRALGTWHDSPEPSQTHTMVKSEIHAREALESCSQYWRH
jgi:hypothetical protein